MTPNRLLLLLLPLTLLLSSSPSLAARPIFLHKLQSAHSTFRIPPAFQQLAAGVWAEFASLLNAGLGDTRPSLAFLKRYFAQFGYLNLTYLQNVTSLFDSPTLAALQLYQQSFNLTVSGRLDMPTLLKIMTPRCGREDVADGIPFMLQSPSLATNRTFTDTQQLVGRYAFFPSMPSWPASQRNLSYAFSAMNETQRLSADQRRQAFANAFNEWAAVVPINFTETDDYEAADIKIEFVSFGHGDAEPFDGVLGILAHAFSPTDGRFHLDDSEFWYASSAGDSGSGASQEIDLQSVATHEIGHLIGLAHSPVENAIMYPSLGPRQVKVQLQPDDIQGAQALYGINPDYNPNNPLPGIPHSVGDVSIAYRYLLPPCSLYLAFCLLHILLTSLQITQ